MVGRKGWNELNAESEKWWKAFNALKPEEQAKVKADVLRMMSDDDDSAGFLEKPAKKSRRFHSQNRGFEQITTNENAKL